MYRLKGWTVQRTCTHTHARTHAHARTHTQGDMAQQTIRRNTPKLAAFVLDAAPMLTSNIRVKVRVRERELETRRVWRQLGAHELLVRCGEDEVVADAAPSDDTRARV